MIIVLIVIQKLWLNSIKSLEIGFFSYKKNVIIWLINMRKLGLLFIGILIVVLLLIVYMDYNNDSYLNMVKVKIAKNTGISDMKYVNKYGEYYIVFDNDYLYLIDNEYKIILEIEKFLLHENDNNYDIIYKDNQFMYFNEIYADGIIIYEYYDIYKYELIDKTLIGGSDG